MDASWHYQMRAEAVLELSEALDDAHRIPATPAWNLRELIAHLTGVAVDVSRGRIEDYARPVWTERQVAIRNSYSRQQLVEEWRASWPQLCATLDDPVSKGLDPSFPVLPVVDLIAHEHDIRESVELFEFSDPSVWPLVEQRRLEVLSIQCDAWNQSLEVRTPEGDDWMIGCDEIRLAVTADRYELWRSLEGRRSRDSVRRFDWTLGPGSFLEHWVGSVFQWPDATEGQPRTPPRTEGAPHPG